MEITNVILDSRYLTADPQCTGFENVIRRGIFLNQSIQQIQELLEEIVEFSGLGNRISHPL
jgi:ABC-type polysaccharide/polyol phosphate transport system ATPase subunit